MCSSDLQSAATEHASQSKKQLRKRDADHRKDDDAIRRKGIVGCREPLCMKEENKERLCMKEENKLKKTL